MYDTARVHAIIVGWVREQRDRCFRQPLLKPEFAPTLRPAQSQATRR